MIQSPDEHPNLVPDLDAIRLDERDMGDLMLHMYYEAREDLTSRLGTEKDPRKAAIYISHIPEITASLVERRGRIEHIPNLVATELAGYPKRYKTGLQLRLVQVSDKQRQAELFPDDNERREELFAAKSEATKYRTALPKRPNRKR